MKAKTKIITLAFGGVFLGLSFFVLTSNQYKTAEPAAAETVRAAATDLCTAGLDDDDGSGDGVLDLTASETSFDNTDIEIINCTIAIDGSHSFTNITVGDSSGVDDSILTQTDTTTVGVVRTTLTVSGTITVLSDGRIDVDGKGFTQGRTSDGVGGITTTGAATQESGGGHGGVGGDDNGVSGSSYDSLTQPTDPGGGPGSSGVGQGGGYLRIITDDLALTGVISADANGANVAGGAGGGIWLTTTGSLTGAGTIKANGEAPSNLNYGGGAGGRIAFYYDSSQPGNGGNLPYTFLASGGNQPSGGGFDSDGGAGTIYIEDTDTHTAGQGDIIISSANSGAEGLEDLSVTPIPDGTYDDISIQGSAFAKNNGTITINNDLFFDTNGQFAAETLNISGDLNITDGGVLTHTEATTSVVHRLTVTVTGNTSIDATSSIDVDAKGFPDTRTSDGAGGVTNTGGASSESGGSHGGVGGKDNGVTGVAYDSLTEPVDPGGGSGGSTSIGGYGGGYLRLITVDLANSGTISADGGPTNVAGGAGGGIWITATGSLTGSGTITANGTDAATLNFGAGGGGRTALYYDSSQPGNGTVPFTFEAIGGFQPSGGGFDADGGAGTVYIEDTNTHTAGQGDIFINNGGNTIVGLEDLSETVIPDGTYDDLTIGGDAFVNNDGTITINGDLFFDTRGKFAAETLNISGDLTLTDNSVLTHSIGTNSEVHRLTATVTGNTSIDATSSINLEGKGFPEARTSDGSGGVTSSNSSSSESGGSHGGVGGDDDGAPGIAYDSLTEPEDPGGGSGGSTSIGGNGGGYVRLTTVDLTNNGTINANAGTTNVAGGAGGGVWITATGSLTGSGTITANGTDAATLNFGAGGGGRTALYYDSSQPGNGTVPFTFEAIGGFQPSGGGFDADGGAGTVYIEDTNTHTAGQGDIFINNGGSTIVALEDESETFIPDGTYDDLTIGGDAFVNNNGTITLTGDLFFDTRGQFAAETLNIGGDLTLTDNSVLTHTVATNTVVHRLTATVTGNTSIDATSSIDLDGKGFLRSRTSDGAGGTTGTGSSTSESGGSHGGVGGQDNGAPGVAYDSLSQPLDPGGGSGGSTPSNLGIGGGYLRLITVDFANSGLISADGGPTTVAGGAGGGIWITTTGSLTGAGSITANGRDAANLNHGSGAGGRTAFYFDSSVSGNPSTPPYTFEAFGGDTPAGGAFDSDGAAGTIFIKDSQQTDGDLIVNHNSLSGTTNTPLFVSVPAGEPTARTFFNLSVINLGRLEYASPCAGVALTVNGTTDLSGGGQLIDGSGGACTTSFATLNITPAVLDGGTVSASYNDTVVSAGGYAPKTYQCLDGLGGSVVTCNNASANLPNGLTMNSSGVVSGTPTATGVFNFVVRVTDSDPGGAQTDEETMQITVGNPPNEPVLVSPSDSSTINVLDPVLEATYSDTDPGDVGTVEFRVSSGSSADCINNVSIVSSGSSATTATNNEDASFTVSPNLTDLTTYEWCARNNDGTATSNSGVFTTMGSFTVDLSFSPGGGNPISGSPEQQVQQQQTDDSQDEPSESDDTETEEPIEDTEQPEEEVTEPQVPEVVEPQVPEVIEPVEPIIPTPPPSQEEQEAPGDLQPPPPSPPPTEQDTSQIDNVIDQVLLQEEIFPPPAPQQGKQTTSQSDGRSFTIEVTDEGADEQGDEDSLTINGLASTDQDRIEFTGTTSEPNVTITLIFNNGVSVIVTSDEKSEWSTFVSANELNILPGQSATITIDAIAAKDSLVSDRVTIGTVQLDREMTGDIAAEFDSIVSESEIITDIQAITKEIAEVIKEQEQQIQTTLTAAAPIVIVSSAPLWSYLPYVPTLIYHLISYFVGFLGRRRKEERLYGVVYNSITKQPLGLVILRIYEKESNKLVSTRVTDKQGKYEVLLPQGEYRLEARKPGFTFPSGIVTTEVDGEYTNIYSKEGLDLSEGLTSAPDIPLDPIDAKRNFQIANVLKKVWLIVQGVGHYLAVPTLIIGSLISIVVLWVSPEALTNWLLAAAYVILLALQLKLREKVQKAWGVVYDVATNAVLPLTTIQLIDPEYGKVVKSRLTDYQGRYAFLPEPGKYVMKASKEGYEQTEVVEGGKEGREPVTGDISVEKPNQRISGDLPMKQS